MTLRQRTALVAHDSQTPAIVNGVEDLVAGLSPHDLQESSMGSPPAEAT